MYCTVQINRMELYKRDTQINKIEQEINRKLQLLKQKSHQREHTNNPFLKNVHKQYKKYNTKQIEEKQKELISFQNLERYLSNLIQSDELNDEQKRIAMYDKKEILNKIEQIKQELQI